MVTPADPEVSAGIVCVDVRRDAPRQRRDRAARAPGSSPARRRTGSPTCGWARASSPRPRRWTGRSPPWPGWGEAASGRHVAGAGEAEHARSSRCRGRPPPAAPGRTAAARSPAAPGRGPPDFFGSWVTAAKTKSPPITPIAMPLAMKPTLPEVLVGPGDVAVAGAAVQLLEELLRPALPDVVAGVAEHAETRSADQQRAAGHREHLRGEAVGAAAAALAAAALAATATGRVTDRGLEGGERQHGVDHALADVAQRRSSPGRRRPRSATPATPRARATRPARSARSRPPTPGRPPSGCEARVWRAPVLDALLRLLAEGDLHRQPAR